MIAALALLLGCQLLGEILVRGLALPLPGPVAGLALLFAWLVWRGRGDAPEGAVPPDLARVGDGLLANLSLLFVPAAVGVVKYLRVLWTAAIPIAITVAASTLLTLLVTALTFRLVSRLVGASGSPRVEEAGAPDEDRSA